MVITLETVGFIAATIISAIMITWNIVNYILEKKAWNKGKCPRCDCKWLKSPGYSSVGREFECGCKNIITITYNFDK